MALAYGLKMPIYQFPHSRKLLGLANGFRNGIELEEYEINNPKFLLVTLRSNTRAINSCW